MEEKELILKLIDLRKKEKETPYMLLHNTKAPDVELAVIKATGLKNMRAYYPDKEFIVLLEKTDMGTLLEKLGNMNLTDYDVVFIDHIDYNDFFLLNRYLRLFTGVRTVVPSSSLRAKMESNRHTIVDKIKAKIDEGDINITLFDQLMLGKSLGDILAYAKEKEITLSIEEV